jgi:regulator of protease activity HflC (stomatin/prohibitin superfamily)
MKNLLINHIWSVTISAFVVVSIIFALIVGMWVNFLTSFLLGVMLFLILLAILLIKAIVSVPERYNYILTYFGRYHKTLKPGLNIVYPWFGIFEIPIAFNVSEHSVQIFADAKGDFGEMVEFKESAAWIRLSTRVKVVNPRKAFTKVEDVYKEIKDIFKKHFRAYAEDKDVLDFTDKNNSVDLDTLFVNSTILDYIENNWGVKIISIRLEDIIFSEADRKAREAVYAERNKLEVVALQNKQLVSKARAEAKKITEIAKAEQTAQEFEGLGLKVALERIIESNLSPEEASRFLQSIKKWEAVPQVQTGFFSDSNQSSAESGISKQAMAEVIAIANEIGKK